MKRLLRKFSRRQIPLLYLLFPFTFFSSFTFQIINNWPIAKLWKVRGVRNYEDLHAILALAKCSQGSLLSDGTACIFPYGNLLQKLLRLLPFTANQTDILGIFSFIALGVFLTALVYRFQFEKTFFIYICIILFCSPPTILLIERGNFDIWMYLLVGLSAILFAKGKEVFGTLLLGISALLKFYTFPLLILPAVMYKNYKVRLVAAILFIGSLIQTILEQKTISLHTQIGAYASFGSLTFGIYINKFFHNILNIDIFTTYTAKHLIGLLIFFLIFLIYFYFLNVKSSKFQITSNNKRDLQKNGFIYWLFLLNFGAHICCFIYSNNFSYRLDFLLISSICFLSFYRSNKQLIGIVTILSILSAWLNYNVFKYEIIGNISIFILSIIFSSEILLNTNFPNKLKNFLRLVHF